MSVIQTPPLPGQVFALVRNLDHYDDDAPAEYIENVEFRGTPKDANVTTSKVLGKETHKLIIDLDIPAKLIPSSTPGHFHLYIDKELSKDRYFSVLAALKEAGLIEPGYLAQASNVATPPLACRG